MTSLRNTRRQRLEAAGWTYVAGWLPPEHGKWAEDTKRGIAAHAPEADRIAATARQPGRPKGEGK